MTQVASRLPWNWYELVHLWKHCFPCWNPFTSCCCVRYSPEHVLAPLFGAHVTRKAQSQPDLGRKKSKGAKTWEQRSCGNCTSKWSHRYAKLCEDMRRLVFQSLRPVPWRDILQRDAFCLLSVCPGSWKQIDQQRELAHRPIGKKSQFTHLMRTHFRCQE